MTEVCVRPTAMAAGGDALARDDDGRVVFVEGALPGERVRARLTDARRDFARAVTVEVLEPSPHRVAPPCAALAAGCGGCTWQHVSAEAQAGLKADVVTDALRRIGRMADPPAPSVTPLAGIALRTTARLAVSPTGRAGHRPRRGSGAVETDRCAAVHPLVDELIVAGRYPGATQVVLRASVATGERVALVDRGAGAVRVPAGVTVVEEGVRAMAAVHEVVAGRRLRISANAFFQSGPVAAAGLVEAVAAAAGDALAPGALLVDAYAGVGLYGSVLAATTGVTVIAVENEPSAAADARVNLADVDGRVVEAEVGKWRLRRGDPVPTVVVADPSRTGLGRPGVAALTATGAPRLVLVSCDPASLGRDTALLADAGYGLRSVALVDAFPDTFHVEVVSRFDRLR